METYTYKYGPKDNIKTMKIAFGEVKLNELNFSDCVVKAELMLRTKSINFYHIKRCYQYLNDAVYLSYYSEYFRNFNKIIQKMVICLNKMTVWINKHPHTNPNVQFLFGQIYILKCEPIFRYGSIDTKNRLYHFYKGWYYFSRPKVKYTTNITIVMMEYCTQISQFETNADCLFALCKLQQVALNQLIKIDWFKPGILHARHKTTHFQYFFAIAKRYFNTYTSYGYYMCIKTTIRGLKYYRQWRKRKPIIVEYESPQLPMAMTALCFSYCMLQQTDILRSKYATWIKLMQEEPHFEKNSIKSFNLVYRKCIRKDIEHVTVPVISQRKTNRIYKIRQCYSNFVSLLSTDNGMSFIKNVLCGKQCGYCGKKSVTLKVCKGCNQYYCSRKCQKKDWIYSHRRICVAQILASFFT
eukprot:14358_1